MNYEFDTNRKTVAQGDVLLVPIKRLPEGLEAEKSENGNFIVTHSETGHHHVVMERPGTQMFKGMDTFTGFLSLSEGQLLEHLRSNNTHAPIMLEAGDYLIKRQTQHSLAGWERAAD